MIPNECHACDLGNVCIERRCVIEERLEIRPVFEVCHERLRVVAVSQQMISSNSSFLRPFLVAFRR